MKITKRSITAASDFRTFNGYSIEELEESFPDLYYNYFYDIQNDVDTVYVSDDPDCEYIGCLDTDGMYCVYKLDDPDFGPGWFEVEFSELAAYLQ